LFAEWRGVRSGESCYAVKPPTVVRRLRYRIRLETRSIRCDLRAQQVFCDAGFFFWLAALVYAVSRTVQYQFTCGVLQDYYPGIQDEAQSVIAMLYLFSGVLIVASLTKLAYLIWVGRQILYRFPWSF
jgi:hypothetical protein